MRKKWNKVEICAIEFSQNAVQTTISPSSIRKREKILKCTYSPNMHLLSKHDIPDIFLGAKDIEASKFKIKILSPRVLVLQNLVYYRVEFSSVAQLCPTLCNPMNCSTPGLPVHHQLPEFTQTHIHRVSDAIQPSHPLSFPSPPAPNPSQHQSLFQWVNSSHEVAKVLEFQL